MSWSTTTRSKHPSRPGRRSPTRHSRPRQPTNVPNMAAEGQKDQVAGDLKQAGEKAKDALKN